MWLKHLEIHDLRNLQRVALDLSPRLNYFYGDNGAGKTAVLEAVHLLARGRSFRTPYAAELIRHGQSTTVVHALVVDEHRGDLSLGISRGRGGRADFRIEGAPGGRLSQVAELLPMQVMVPSLSDLVFGSPRVRRQWLDWGLFHVEHQHLQLLRQYVHALRQRNAALKAVGSGELDQASLEVWSEELARLGESVTDARVAYLLRLVPVVGEVLEELAPGMDVTFRYERGWAASESLGKILGESVRKEVKSGSTQSGPHRADVVLECAGLAAGASLSRGQGKALASALVLAQARLLRQQASRSSVFLIDDIGAELDLPHSERFFRLLVTLGAQILATSNMGPAGLAGIPEVDTRTFHVEHGAVRQEGAINASVRGEPR